MVVVRIHVLRVRAVLNVTANERFVNGLSAVDIGNSTPLSDRRYHVGTAAAAQPLNGLVIASCSVLCPSWRSSPRARENALEKAVCANNVERNLSFSGHCVQPLPRDPKADAGAAGFDGSPNVGLRDRALPFVQYFELREHSTLTHLIRDELPFPRVLRVVVAAFGTFQPTPFTQIARLDDHLWLEKGEEGLRVSFSKTSCLVSAKRISSSVATRRSGSSAVSISRRSLSVRPNWLGS
jgi:hypothetical protein